jgi:hypothetical protein
MQRARRPSGINKNIVEILLRVFDNSVDVLLRFVYELTQPSRVVVDNRLMTDTESCPHVSLEQLDRSSLVSVRDRHSD